MGMSPFYFDRDEFHACKSDIILLLANLKKWNFVDIYTPENVEIICERVIITVHVVFYDNRNCVASTSRIIQIK